MLLHYSPLYIATQQDNLQLVKQLIENGANPYDKDANGDTLLHYAAMKGKLDIFKYLVEDVGCNPATEGYDSRTTLHAAADSNQLHIVQYLIEQCKLDPTDLDNCRYTALSSACTSGDLKIVRYLMTHMLEYMNMEAVLYDSHVVTGDYVVCSPLCRACLGGHLSVVKYLVEECECDTARPEGENFVVPLTAAVSGNHLPVVQYLARHTSAKQVHHVTRKWSLLHLSVNNQSLEMIKFLINGLHCDPNVLFNNHTPLFHACHIGNLDIIKYFIKSVKCNPSACVRECHGAQAIHIAAESGQLDVVKYLEKQSCSPSAALLENEVTPLHLAAQHGHLPVVRYLFLKHHCDPLRVCKYSFDSLGYAAFGGEINVLKYFLTKS